MTFNNTKALNATIQGFSYFKQMLLLTKGQTSENIVVTLTERRDLTEGNYLFIFTHYTTKQIVTKIFNFLADDSDFPERFNQFEIDTSVLFDGCPVGQWTYEVYEEEGVLIDPTGLNLLEEGILVLKPAVDFSFAEYDQAQSFKVYGG